MKNTWLFLVTVLFALNANAQIQNYINPNTSIINDQQLVYDVMEAQYPGYKQHVQESFDYHIQKSNSLSKTAIHDVNLVVHVVYQSPEQNIHDSIIENQVAILNADFQRNNADTVNLRAMFDPIVGRPNIRFNLVHIERVSTSSTFSVGFAGLPDNVKQTSNGGSDAWDTEHFVNIWVCNLESVFGALFGYAYPPAGLPNWPAGQEAPSPELDGIVLDYRTIGTNNPNVYPDPQGGGGNIIFTGRTATHEVGHYFGMRHIWGDGGGFFGGDSCGEDDGINDTPNQGMQSNFDCSMVQNSCIDSIAGQPDPNDMPDLVENYMDYSDELCSNMWTAEQASFMRSVVENERVGLLTQWSGIEENIFYKNVTVSPNPTNGLINLSLQNSLKNETLVQVTNVLGNKIESFVLNKHFKGEYPIDLSKNGSGIYFIQLENGSDKKTFKIIVQ